MFVDTYNVYSQANLDLKKDESQTLKITIQLLEVSLCHCVLLVHGIVTPTLSVLD